jgi:hypothetical protein
MGEESSGQPAAAPQGQQAPQGPATPPVAAAPASEASAASQPATWYGDGVDDATKGYIENKGWKAAQDVITGYRNLEQLLGHDRAGRTVTIPKEGEDASDFYAKLGRPESPEKYSFGEGSNTDSAKWYAKTAFDLGLSNDQATKLFQSFDQYTAEKMNESASKRAESAQTELNEMKAKWGAAFDKNFNAARFGAEKLGFNDADLKSIQDAVGIKTMLERFSQVGLSYGEHAFQSSSSTSDQNFVMSPQQALSKIDDLKLDKDFMAKYMEADKTAVQRMTQLMKLAYPG